MPVIRLFKLLARRRGLIAAIVALALAGAAVSATAPRILGHATDLLFNGIIGRQLPAGIDKEQAVAAARARGDNTFAQMLSSMNVKPAVGIDFAAVGRTLLLALAVYLVAVLMVWCQARLLRIAIQHSMVALWADVEDKVHRLPLSYIDSCRRGELLSRLTYDIDKIATALEMVVELSATMLSVVGVLVMMLTMSPLLALITGVTVPLCVLVNRAIVARAKRLCAAQAASTGRLNAHIEEIYSGFALVKTFGHRARVQEQFGELNDEVYRAGLGAQFVSELISPTTVLVGNLGYVAVAVVGGLLMATGQISLGGIQAFIQYVRQFNQPLGEFASSYGMLQSGMASAQRVFDLLDTPEMEPDTGLALPSGGGPGGCGRVEFEHISFGYRPGTPVIKDLSLVAEPGSTVAIVGPTGAGKSTLVNLLMRFYELDGGRILIDGVDIATVDRHALRSRIGMVLQDTWLFAGTIADNIGYGHPGASRQDIVEAARAAHVNRFVQTLPDGYDSWVSEDGGNLSAGEKQLITIARAFLARPQLLILDEATSSVDTGTEVLIQKAMAELRRDRTCFVIAHRLSTIRDADLILVMHSGRVIERGSHDQLMAQRGAYYAMTQAAQMSAPALPTEVGEVRDTTPRHRLVLAGKPPHRLDVRPMCCPTPDTVLPSHRFGSVQWRRSAIALD